MLQIVIGTNMWDKNTPMDWYEYWMADNSVKAHKTLPCYVLWGLWLTRNKMTFPGKILATGLVSHKIRLSYREC